MAPPPGEPALDLSKPARPALAAFLPDDSTKSCRGYGIMVMNIADDAIATITSFPDPDLFPIFGLSPTP